MTASVPFAERGGPLRGAVDLATLCYPAFLFGGSLGDLLPAFHFHDETREWLEPRLQYLVENGYRTVTCDEIARLVVDGVRPGPRAVALTFDDAWASVWTVAMPLLRRFDLRAIVFAIPGRVDEASAVRPVGATGGPTFATWPELRAMHASGTIDVQSHTRSHAMIFSSAEVVDFVTPAFAREPLLNRPIRSLNGRLDAVDADALGTPLYLRRSRMSDARRRLPDEAVADRCGAHVARNGGARFFDRPHWRRELEPLARDVTPRFETDAERAAAILTELADGRGLLNARLGTTTVRHVAMPWGIAGRIARQALAATGHETAYSERPLGRRGVRAGDDRFQLMRLNGRFLTCLPGRGRQWFFTTVR
jgi:hypothetical protein